MIYKLSLNFIPRSREDYDLVDAVEKLMTNNHIQISTRVLLVLIPEYRVIKVKIFGAAYFIKKNSLSNANFTLFETKLNKLLEPFGLTLDKLVVSKVTYKKEIKLIDTSSQPILKQITKNNNRFGYLGKHTFFVRGESSVQTIEFKDIEKGIKLSINGLYKSGIKNILDVKFNINSDFIYAFSTSERMGRDLKSYWNEGICQKLFRLSNLENILLSKNLENMEENVNVTNRSN